MYKCTYIHKQLARANYRERDGCVEKLSYARSLMLWLVKTGAHAQCKYVHMHMYTHTHKIGQGCNIHTQASGLVNGCNVGH